MWLWSMTLTWDFEGQILKKLYHWNKRMDWHGTKECEIRCWTQVVTFNFDLTHDLDLGLLNFWSPYFRNGMVDWHGMREMWVWYNVGHTMGFLLGHSAWQKHWPSNGSMWNCYSFQPVSPWMGCPLTDLGAEECCHSPNALLQLIYNRYVFLHLLFFLMSPFFKENLSILYTFNWTPVCCAVIPTACQHT